MGLFLSCQFFYAQGIDEYTGGYKIKFDEEGSKYLRIIAWGQFWTTFSDNVPDEASKLNFSIRRARVLTYTSLNDKFLILTHFGLNNLSGNNASPLGYGENSQLFFHDLWGEWKIVNNHAVGAGLHYWNGISRLTNQSTLNMMTLDNNRESWATLGLSDQFARHIGIYLKGKFGRFEYRLAVNEANTSTLDNRFGEVVDPITGNTVVVNNSGETSYNGRRILGSRDAGKVFQGYFEYNFLDKESNFLPYKVGTYLGSKKVFNIGAGFFSHANGVVNSNGEGEDVNIFAVDAFYDSPVGANNGAITAYAVFQSNDYGDNYRLGPYTTGNMFYTHVGYLIGGEKTKTRYQPYVSFNSKSIDAINDNATRFGLGGNIYFTGHHSKLSIEYTNLKVGDADSQGLFTVQAMIYL